MSLTFFCISEYRNFFQHTHSGLQDLFNDMCSHYADKHAGRLVTRNLFIGSVAYCNLNGVVMRMFQLRNVEITPPDQLILQILISKSPLKFWTKIDLINNQENKVNMLFLSHLTVT